MSPTSRSQSSNDKQTWSKFRSEMNWTLNRLTRICNLWCMLHITLEGSATVLTLCLCLTDASPSSKSSCWETESSGSASRRQALLPRRSPFSVLCQTVFGAGIDTSLSVSVIHRQPSETRVKNFCCYCAVSLTTVVESISENSVCAIYFWIWDMQILWFLKWLWRQPQYL